MTPADDCMSWGAPEDQLSTAETLRLIERAQAGDHTARQAVVRGNSRLVVREVYKLGVRPNRDEFRDFAQAGMSGLVVAVDRFKTHLGLAFATYAVPWIRAALQDELAQFAGAGLYGRGILSRVRAARNKAAALAHKLGRQPTPKELAAHAEVSVMVAECALSSTVGRVYPLPDTDARPAAGCAVPGSRLDRDIAIALSAGSESATIADLDRRRKLAEVLDAVDRLIPHQKTVVELKCGIGCPNGAPMTNREIAAYLNLSQRRVNQLWEESLKLLRRAVRLQETADGAFEVIRAFPPGSAVDSDSAQAA